MLRCICCNQIFIVPMDCCFAAEYSIRIYEMAVVKVVRSLFLLFVSKYADISLKGIE